MIKILLSKDEYEYDIHSLVKAFYPEEQIKVKNEETILHHPDLNAWRGTQAGVKVKNEDHILQDNNKIPKNILIKTPFPAENKSDTEVSLQQKDLQIFIDLEEQKIQIKAIQNEVELYSKTTSVPAHGKSESENFFTHPDFDTRQSGQIEARQDRNQLKRSLYDCLSHITGKKLPWGTLTGVRPTKIAFEKLEKHITEEDIKFYMEEQYLCQEEKIAVSLQVAKREIALLHEMDYRNGYSIYIGIPFCPSICLYCSFTSYSLEKFGGIVEQYLHALFKEITYAGTCYTSKRLNTIYLGGGTPTTLTALQLDRLLTHIGNTFDFSYVSEYTVEAGRPDSITLEKLKVLKEHGVTRISINPQTMRQDTLDIIGRKHTVGEVIEAFHMARDMGHDNINMDMIIGLPGERKEDVAYTLQEIDKLKPDSLTVHTLAIKRAARLNMQKENYQGMVPVDTMEMLKLTSDYTKKAGYLPYYLYRQKNMADNLENIGYAKFGKEGLYNILIMEEKQTILALGAGALSKFVFHEENRIERVENVKSLKDYVERIDEMIERKRSFLQVNSPYL